MKDENKIWRKFTYSQEQAIFKRDKYKCQLAKRMGADVLIERPCSKKLLVWRVNEDRPSLRPIPLLSDGITVCKRCYRILDEMMHLIKADQQKKVK